MGSHLSVYLAIFLFSYSLLAKSIDDETFGAPIPISQQCKDFIKLLQPKGYHYGWVRSSEDPNDSTSPSIYVFYYSHKSHHLLIPTLYFNGGPLHDSHTAPKAYMDPYGRYPFRMIFTDQRGTGCSSSLPDYDRENSTRYVLWSSIGIVHDAEQIRAHLGLQKWNLMGQSYGGIIAQRYIEKHPESILKVVAHSGLALGNLHEAPPFYELRFDHQIDVIKHFLEIYPQTVPLVQEIVRRRLCAPAQFHMQTCGASLIAEIGKAYQLWGEIRNWQYMSQIFTAIVNQNISRPLSHENSRFINSRTLNKEIAKYYITLIDVPHLYLNFNRLRQRALRELGSIELIALSEFYHYANRDFSGADRERMFADSQIVFSKHNVDYINLETIKQNLESHQDLQFYVFSAEWDYMMPPIAVERATRRMGNRVQYAQLINEGHFSYNHPCVYAPLVPYPDDQKRLTEQYCRPKMSPLPFASADFQFYSL